MDSYQTVLGHAPWAPGFGNHEYLEGDNGNRLRNITHGMVQALGDHMSPQYYSVDIGLLHLVHLDFSPYYCNFTGCEASDNCGYTDEYTDPLTGEHDEHRYKRDVLGFASRDLAAVDRSKTPWVFVTTHYPLYETTAAGEKWVDKNRAIVDLEPLLKEHQVDVYFCGHNHNYETTWPVLNNRTLQKDYIDPAGPIHIVSGAAGAPELDPFGPSQSFTRKRIFGSSYSRATFYNETHLQWEQVMNDDGSIADDFYIVKK